MTVETFIGLATRGQHCDDYFTPSLVSINTNLLEEGGELLCGAGLSGLIPQCDLLNGVLQELGHLQFDSQLCFQPLLLQEQTQGDETQHFSLPCGDTVKDKSKRFS